MKGPLLLALLLSGCSHAVEPAASPRRADGCGVSGIDAPVRDVVLDSAGLSARLASLLGAAPADSVSLIVRHTADSTAVRLQRAGALAPEVRQSLEAAVEADLLPPDNPQGNPPYRLVFTPADRGIHVGEVRMCFPRLLNADELHDATARGGRGIRHDARAIVRIQVDTSGLAQPTGFFRSSGDPNVDALALAVAAVARFAPATWDGEPTVFDMGLPVEFVMGTRRRR